MRKLPKILVVAGLLAPLFVAGIVLAEHSTDSGTGEPRLIAQANTQAAAPQTKTTKTTLQERIKQHKDALKTPLTAAQTNLIKTRCKAAQGVVSSVSGRIKGLETSRQEVYTNIHNRLTKLATALQNKDISANELQAEVNTLQGKVDTYKTDLDTYKQAVEDLAALDCAADPTAFKATLEAARTAQQKVAKDMQDIRTYITGTIKPTLEKIRTALETKEKASSRQ